MGLAALIPLGLVQKLEPSETMNSPRSRQEDRGVARPAGSTLRERDESGTQAGQMGGISRRPRSDPPGG
jgi:hypothetical protein